MSADPAKANLFQSMALGGLAASFAVNFTHPIVSGVRLKIVADDDDRPTDGTFLILDIIYIYIYIYA
jgi:hypothetical protein